MPRQPMTTALWDFHATLVSDHETTMSTGTVEAPYLIAARMLIAHSLPGGPRPPRAASPWRWTPTQGCEYAGQRRNKPCYYAYRCHGYDPIGRRSIVLRIAPRQPLHFTLPAR